MGQVFRYENILRICTEFSQLLALGAPCFGWEADDPSEEKQGGIFATGATN
jgi:hypothetical protein